MFRAWIGDQTAQKTTWEEKTHIGMVDANFEARDARLIAGAEELLDKHSLATTRG